MQSGMKIGIAAALIAGVVLALLLFVSRVNESSTSGPGDVATETHRESAVFDADPGPGTARNDSHDRGGDAPSIVPSAGSGSAESPTPAPPIHGIRGRVWYTFDFTTTPLVQVGSVVTVGLQVATTDEHPLRDDLKSDVVTGDLSLVIPDEFLIQSTNPPDAEITTDPDGTHRIVWSDRTIDKESMQRSDLVQASLLPISPTNRSLGYVVIYDQSVFSSDDTPIWIYIGDREGAAEYDANGFMTIDLTEELLDRLGPAGNYVLP